MRGDPVREDHVLSKRPCRQAGLANLVYMPFYTWPAFCFNKTKRRLALIARNVVMVVLLDTATKVARVTKLACGKVAGWQGGRVAGWQGGRVAGWQGGRVAGWQGGRVAGWQGGREWIALHRTLGNHQQRLLLCRKRVL